MTKAAPVVYLLHGEDDFAIAQFVSELEAKLGDPALVALNLTRLDGRTYNPDELLGIASAMPFLAKRRIVILTHPLARLSGKTAQEKFLDTLNQLPPTTALILIEERQLTEDRERRKNKLHWLERWAEEAGERVYLRAFRLPKGQALVQLIQEQARAAGGTITPRAADLLATLVGEDPRLADQEIQKLLAYANYRRPVDEDDVQALTTDSAQGNVFTMVDALGSGDGRQALKMLHRLLEEQDAFSIFGMVVRQFRLLLLAREVLDAGGHKEEAARAMKAPPFVAEKMLGQARRFSLPVLEAVYHRLLDLDAGMKTGQIAADLALDLFIAGFTTPS